MSGILKHPVEYREVLDQDVQDLTWRELFGPALYTSLKIYSWASFGWRSSPRCHNGTGSRKESPERKPSQLCRGSLHLPSDMHSPVKKSSDTWKALGLNKWNKDSKEWEHEVQLSNLGASEDSMQEIIPMASLFIYKPLIKSTVHNLTSLKRWKTREHNNNAEREGVFIYLLVGNPWHWHWCNHVFAIYHTNGRCTSPKNLIINGLVTHSRQKSFTQTLKIKEFLSFLNNVIDMLVARQVSKILQGL